MTLTPPEIAGLIIGGGILLEIFLASLMYGFLRGQGLNLTWGVPTYYRTGQVIPETDSAYDSKNVDADAWAVVISIFWPLTVIAIIMVLIARAGLSVARWSITPRTKTRKEQIPTAKIHKE